MFFFVQSYSEYFEHKYKVANFADFDITGPLKYLNSLMRNAVPGSGMEKIRIRDEHPGSATLFVSIN